LARKTHYFGVMLKTEKNKSEAFEAFQESIDVAVLNDAGVYILAWTFKKPTDKQVQNGEDETPKSGNKFLAFIKKKAPGILALLKGRKWWHFYIGFVVVVLTLQFIWNLLH